MGVALTTIAIVVFLFIKPTLEGGKGGKRAAGDEENSESLIDYDKEEGEELNGDGTEAADGGEASWIDGMPTGMKRIFGLTTAALSGCFYGLNFTPPSYVAQRAGSATYPNASPNLVDYGKQGIAFCGSGRSAVEPTMLCAWR